MRGVEAVKKLIALALLLTLLASPAYALNDKVGHGIVGAGLAMMGTPDEGLRLAIYVSVAKEVMDYTNDEGTAEWADVGAGIGGAVVVYFIRQATGWSFEW